MEFSGPPKSPFARWAFAGLLFGASSIAFAPIFVRWSPVPASATAFWRLFLAIPPLLLCAAPIRRQNLQQPTVHAWREYGWRLAMPGVFLAGDLALWHWSIHFTSVSNATLLGNMAPVFVTLIAWLFWRERITRRFLLGLVLAILGTIVLLGGSLNLSRSHFIGDLFGIVTAMFYAGYISSIARLRQSLSTVSLMLWTSGVGSICALAIALLSREPVVVPAMATWDGIGPLLGLALIVHVLGQGLIVNALAHLPAPFAAVSLLLQPLVATLAARVLLGEALSAAQAVGGVIVLIGIVCARRGTYRRSVAGPSTELRP